MVVIEAVADRDVEPGMSNIVESGFPFHASLTGRVNGCHNGFGIRPVDEMLTDPEIDSKLRERLQLVVGLEHQDVDPGNHARNHLVRDLRECFFAELEEHEIRAVSQHQ